MKFNIPSFVVWVPMRPLLQADATTPKRAETASVSKATSTPPRFYMVNCVASLHALALLSLLGKLRISRPDFRASEPQHFLNFVATRNPEPKA